jgi:diguanylate cyclase (GGDEF)-like protein
MENKIPVNPELPAPLEGLPAPGDNAPLIDEEIIGIASGDLGSRIESLERLSEVTRGYDGDFYSDIIYMLTNIRLDEPVAREDWQSILKHKHIMSEKLERNVGIRVATLDFYTNITRQISTPKIIDMKEYTRTVKESITDPLTFCYNRRYFDYIIKQSLALSQETGRPLCLLMVDVDFFKIYNDLNGHIAGDFALIEISRILNVLTRKSDIVARYGGEEFCVVLSNTALPEACAGAEKIREAVEDYRFPNEQNLPGKRLTVSIGVACAAAGEGDPAASPTSLISTADAAMYQAKAQGKNRVVFAGGEFPC